MSAEAEAATVGGQVISAIVAILGALTPTLPYIAKLRAKLSAIRALIARIETSMADGKITPAEATQIIAAGKEIVK